jgi:dinuclear metal center YbgI/SA1388 family protein
MTAVREIAAYADELLQSRITPDYPNALNGLQLENRSGITRIAAAVDFSTRAIKDAITQGANLLVVHHGMFWEGSKQLTGAFYHKVRLLLDNDIAVYSSHLPLDRHAKLGNNVLLARQLGLEPSGNFARFEGIFIGVSGVSDIETAVLVERTRHFAKSYDGELRTTPYTKTRRTKRWAICSGAGASIETLTEAREMAIDTLVVGEGPHWTAIYAEENDLTILYAGHYATETLGVRALADHLGERFAIPSSFVNAPTGL